MFYAHDARCEQKQNDRKSFLRPVELSFPQRSCAKLSLGLAGLHCGGVLGSSWGLLGRLWDTLGRLLVPLSRFLGVSWTLPGHSWTPPGQSEAPFESLWAPRVAPSLDFDGFGDISGWISEGFGDMSWHAFCCLSRFITYCVYLSNNRDFVFTFAFSSSLLVRRSVRSTSAASRRESRACQTVSLSSS